MQHISLPNDDTIAAIATPLGRGGIAVIRVSGKESIDIFRKVFKRPEGSRGVLEFESHRLYKGQVIDSSSDKSIDNVLGVVMKSPHSYTGEDVVEIHCHGGYLAPKKILGILFDAGARPAQAGEFTLRAFLNGRIDLSQAEAVVDIINAQTEEGLKQAELQLEGILSKKITEHKEKLLDILAEVEANVDFPEEDIEPMAKESMIARTQVVINELKKLVETYEHGRIIKNGIYTAILGKPNVGKSSLLNQLVMKDRAIVTPYPGTTRDFIEETIDIKGIPLRLVDTAGLRSTADEIESIGVELTKKKISEAEFIIVVIDGSIGLDEDDISILRDLRDRIAIIAINKIDIPQVIKEETVREFSPNLKIIRISAKQGAGLEELKIAIYETFLGNKKIYHGTEVILSELRHKVAIQKAEKSLNSFLESLKRGDSPEFLAVDLRYAMDSLGEITGEITTEDILGKVFSKFCIGK